MPSPDFFDFEPLLKPISDESPAGESYRGLLPNEYMELRRKRDESIRNERMALFDDGAETEGQSYEVHWDEIYDQCSQALAEQSKDLQLATWMTEAAARLEGFCGIRDGFRLIRNLCLNFWDILHPLPDEEDGMETRVAPLAGLNGEDTDGPLIGAINNILITNPRSTEPHPLWKYESNDSRHEVLAGAADTPPEFLVTIKEDIELAQTEFQQLDKLLEERCGTDASGYPMAPPTSRIRDALENARLAVSGIMTEVGAGETGESTGDDEQQAEGGGSPAGASGGAPGQIRTREDAFNTLKTVANYFRKTEPHSPLSYSLEQAIKWGKMPLPELLTELIRDSSTREELFRHAGIPPVKNDDD